ncbi:MAG TPA: discoidin domain-containing protein [Thermoguttaceae bacterium]|nr:discoidin domain-containing protein [Thermoguttaceae bacterium]
MKPIPWNRALLLLFAVATCCRASLGAEDVETLAGKWRFEIDKGDVGVEERWFARELAQSIRLPGSLQEQGYGDEVSVETEWTGNIIDESWFTAPEYEQYRRPGNVKIPFWLQPERHYVGAAWYQRDVTIPDTWRDQRITLHLERCHWESTLWVDGAEIGSEDSLSTPHVYDLTGKIGPGKHTLTIRVDNRVKIGVGVNAHSVSDHTQSNWNGIVGDISLRATPPVWIDDVQVFPRARAVVTIGNATGREVHGNVYVAAACGDHHLFVAAGWHATNEERSTIELTMATYRGCRLWDEFSPNLYRLTAKFDSSVARVERTTTFGMRELGTDGTQFTVNGRRIFLRGTLECCIFPLTGYPPTDVASWERIFGVIKAHGLNHMRFHSWCPPEAAFAAADRAGVYLHVECAAWSNQGATIGDGKPIDRFIDDESDRILRAYGNHPSFCMLAYGNEPAGKRQKQYLGKLVEHWKAADPRRLYTSAAGWPIIPENQFHSTPAPRVHAWGSGLGCRINAKPPETVTDYRDFIGQHDVPVVSHEIGQWCVYPNLDEIEKYTGVLKARNFEVFRDKLAASHMLDRAHDFLIASGRLQTLCYKEEIESALRTPGMGGLQLLDLHDFPGQGTALVGVLDPFWEEKGYVSPEEYRSFAGETVPLARMAKRVWTTGETFEAEVEVAHFGPADLESPRPRWEMRDRSGTVSFAGRFAVDKIATGGLARLGKIRVPLEGIARARKLVLRVELEGTPHANQWDVWVYPEQVDAAVPPDVLVADRLSGEAVGRLKEGGKVLLLPAPGSVRGGRLGKIPPGFSSIFWNTAWTRRQPPHTLGVLCDPAHPALAEFPTESHSNWQWWDLVTKSQIMILDELPPKLRPIVQVIDDWFTARRLGLVFEARVGAGKLLVCSMDLERDLDERPVARQMRRSLLRYLGDAAFDPEHEVSMDEVGSLLQPPPVMQALRAQVTRVDGQQRGHEGRLAIDGDPTTIWHTAWQPQVAGYPHRIEIDLQQETRIAGFTYLPRQDLANGRIAEYEISVSRDGRAWEEPVEKGRFPNGPSLQTVRFDEPLVARYLRLVALSEVNGGPWASAAELDVIPAPRD